MQDDQNGSHDNNHVSVPSRSQGGRIHWSVNGLESNALSSTGVLTSCKTKRDAFQSLAEVVVAIQALHIKADITPVVVSAQKVNRKVSVPCAAIPFGKDLRVFCKTLFLSAAASCRMYALRVVLQDQCHQSNH